MGNDCLERFKMDEEASSSRCQIRECIGGGSDYSWSSSKAWTVREKAARIFRNGRVVQYLAVIE